MSELFHRIKVFVYRVRAGQPHYLLLKPDQGIEGLWGPLQGELGFGDKLETAIRKQVMDDTGMAPPGEVVDLAMPGRFTLGDEEIVEWTYGFRSLSRPDPARLQERWAAYRWAEFGEAYPSLGFEIDRAAIMRLHTFLGAA